jgi:integrase
MEAEYSKAFACGSDAKTAYKELKASLETTLPMLPKHYLVEIRKQVTAQFVKRFKKSRIPKYGSLNKGFNEQEVQAFFKVIKNPKFHLLFSYQAQLGLRLGEARRINIKDIKFESRELVVKTEKAMTLDTLLIPAPLFKETLDYINANKKAIERAAGYLFFKEKGKGRTLEPYLDEGYVRNQFTEFINKAGLDEVYDVSDESAPNKASRKLHRLTTHSLRHYAITRFAEQTNGNVFLTSKFARHLQPSVTMTYINTNKKQLYENIDGAFSVNQAMALKARLSRT